ncbi:MAG TPA: TetR/AcrR family transcriptional regulator [Candidatus Binataceae bacterium]|nr:TetR/AcrR family transcriptional regulator [Candidatus Binataceae bacterium]
MRELDQNGAGKVEGVRERKRRQTRQRIAEQGLRLFLADGYESTTLDAIAAAAGISRRTFFSYFKSKDDILSAWQEGFWDAVFADILRASPDFLPLHVVRDVLIRHVSRFTTDEMIAIDRLMWSSETLLASKPAAYARQEQALFAILCEVWRQPQRQERLRTVAMLSIGTMRLAIDAWNRAGGNRSAVYFLREAFDGLMHELALEHAGAAAVIKKRRRERNPIRQR